ncbi:hypothetical protein Dsin_032244 [Dipteronia sinensis]|uniref:Uncharacterized protein n=1 Tax=Dipteronia sinensis TaxID=43782 RepID=A0AAD9ZMQ2_9ROSI|nr:hypothetical protein Dsin_032244 [Dipteronia sinensis]
MVYRCSSVNRRHLFYRRHLSFCSNRKAIQKDFDVMKGMKCDDALDFSEFLFSCFNRLREKEMSLLVVVLWRIWFLEKPKSSWCGNRSGYALGVLNLVNSGSANITDIGLVIDDIITRLRCVQGGVLKG